MKKVSREEVRKPAEYAAVREEFRRSVLEQKDKRRIHVGSYLTFLFENHDTVLYQIQEMIRAENMTTRARDPARNGDLQRTAWAKEANSAARC